MRKWTAESDHDGYFFLGVLIAPNGNRYSVASEREARDLAQKLNAYPDLLSALEEMVGAVEKSFFTACNGMCIHHGLSNTWTHYCVIGTAQRLLARLRSEGDTDVVQAVVPMTDSSD